MELNKRFCIRKLTIRTMLAYKRHFPTQRTYCRNYGHVSTIIHWAYQIQPDLDKILPFQYCFVCSKQFHKQTIYNKVKR